MSKKVERWGIFEWTAEGPKEGNPFTEVSFSARFVHGNRVVETDGFYDGNGVYKVRCMPDAEGAWSFVTSSNVPALDGRTGEFECTPPEEGNHGPVRVGHKFHFVFEDSTPYIPVGTTCYVWNHQGEALEKQTLETLQASPFNKMRMCVFPKHYLYNENEPDFYAFEGSPEKGWDFTRFNPEFFRHLEGLVLELMKLKIEADLILFHPYDRWGFATMDGASDDRYLKYIVARLAAYRNIWWSFANEYDLMPWKTMNDWDRFFHIVQTCDPYQHLRSVHNCRPMYDYGKPWVTHCSIQHDDVSLVTEWRRLYGKPVVVDECKYEGNIHCRWGNITGQEMVRRFWEGFARGGYIGHGETFVHPQDILWWAKGGKLYGQSPDRIAFLRKIMEEGPAEGIDTADLGKHAHAAAGKGDAYFLVYYGYAQPAYQLLKLPQGSRYGIEIIDTWEMTVTPVEGTFAEECRVELPAKQYIALRIKKIA